MDFTEPGCGGCNPPCWEERIAVNQQQADSVKGVLVSLIDGGDTQSLLSFIQQENSGGKIKNEILAVSPYASDAVLITAINKNKVLPDGILKEILLTNSPLSDDVLDALLNRVPPVAPGVLKEILAAQKGISPRQLLENQMNFFLAEASLAQNSLIQWFLHNDTLGGVDSIISILEADTLPDAKITLVSAYLQTGDTAKAQILVDSLKQVPDLINFANLQQLFIDFGDSLFASIINDSAIRQQVEQIAADTTKAGSMQARVILEMLFDIRIPEVIVLPTQNQLKTGGEHGGEDEQQVEIISKQTNPELFQTLTVYDGYTLISYPNPYREGTIIAAYIPPHIDKSHLTIRCNDHLNPSPNPSDYNTNWNNLGSLAQQGQHSGFPPNADDKLPAGNEFSPPDKKHITTGNQSFSPFLYFSHSAPSEVIPTPVGPIGLDATSVPKTPNSCVPFDPCFSLPPDFFC